MTEIYFIRHSKVLYTAEDKIRPLSEEGKELLEPLRQKFNDIHLDSMVSSPYKRALDTLKPIADEKGIEIVTFEDLRERTVADHFIEDFKTFSERQWENFDYKLPGGESINEVQIRGKKVLDSILKQYDGKTIAIGTHGTFLAVLLNVYDKSVDFAFWRRLQMPDVIKVSFKEMKYVGMEHVSI